MKDRILEALILTAAGANLLLAGWLAYKAASWIKSPTITISIVIGLSILLLHILQAYLSKKSNE
jgi:hypothetical protein